MTMGKMVQLYFVCRIRHKSPVTNYISAIYSRYINKLSGLVCTGLVWSGLVLSGCVWSGLVWSGLVWAGLVWSGLAIIEGFRAILNPPT